MVSLTTQRTGTDFEHEEKLSTDVVEDFEKTGADLEDTKGNVIPFPIERLGTRSEAPEEVEDEPDGLDFGARVSEEPTPSFMKIVRMHFLKPILDALRKVQSHVGSPDAAVYVNRILRTIRRLDEVSPRDPFLEVLFALHDAMSFENNWTFYNAEQFAKAWEILKKYSNREVLNQNGVEKAIMELEEAGFDTTPFPIVLDHTDE